MGPTASGKSKLAMDMAVQHNGVILNADSMQMYKGLPILTAKPTQADQQRVPHFLYGLWDPLNQKNVADWLKHIYDIIPTLQKPIYIVGGTGFYIKALLQGLSAVPKISKDVRQQAYFLSNHLSPEDFYNYVYEKDPVGVKDLHPLNQKRLIRLLEVIIETSRPLHTFFKELLYPPLIVDRVIFLNPTRVDLHNYIKHRTHCMFNGGAIQEVMNFLKDEPSFNHVFNHVIGFKEICSFLKKEVSFDEMIEMINQKTRQYAKRQITFFSNQFDN